MSINSSTEHQRLKTIERLRASYQISSLLVPILEACDIAKKSDVVRDAGASPDELLMEVFSSANQIYQHILTKTSGVLDVSLVMQDLYVILAKSLRNALVMYGSESLAMIRDDVIKMLDSAPQIVDSWIEKISHDAGSGLPTPRSRLEVQQIHHDSIGIATTGLFSVMSPLFVFHNSLYLVGKINIEQLLKLNRESSDFVSELLEMMEDGLSQHQGNLKSLFSVMSFQLCCDICAVHFRDIQKKIIKTESDLESYVKSPKNYLAKVTPGILSSFSLINEESSKVVDKLMPKK